MRIVILDGYTTNPGDLCWDKLKELGECTIYDRTAPGEVLERAAGAEAILTNKVVINSETMAALPDLKYIGVMATGYNVVDINAARERGIIITNIPAYSTPSVGQMVFAHHPASTPLFRRSQQGKLEQESRLLLLRHSTHRAARKKNRYRRTGTDRLQHRPYSHRLRYEGMGLHFQIAPPTSSRNP